jgi:hypothetical protein
MCGANAARLLELGESLLKYTAMFRKMPERFLEIFTRGCRDAISSGSPARLAGAVECWDRRGELYRTVFIPISVNLGFGAFNSSMANPQAGSLPRPVRRQPSSGHSRNQSGRGLLDQRDRRGCRRARVSHLARP